MGPRPVKGYGAIMVKASSTNAPGEGTGFRT
jgi:hypothetical protein